MTWAMNPRPGIIPAYAGSTPSTSTRRRAATDHPRIRGEHVESGPSRFFPAGSSPHTRGAPSAARKTTRPGTDHPRIRGEHVVVVESDGRGQGSSPHTRGAHAALAVPRPLGRIIPAYAGSTRFPFFRHATAQDHPRIRGEHDAAGVGEAARPGSSPHTRGARRLRPVRDRRSGIIPAYAGSTSKLATMTPPPRGSSPHTRGAPVPRLHADIAVGIIPAYAGSTFSARVLSSRATDHPRIRGEHA